MQIKGFFTVLAALVSVAVAADWAPTTSESTTTSTSTMTKTVTVTRCNPSFSACPEYTSSVWKSSVSGIPNWWETNSTSYAVPTTTPYVEVPTHAPPKPTTSALPTGGAAGLVLQSGLLLTLLGAGVALVA